MFCHEMFLFKAMMFILIALISMLLRSLSPFFSSFWCIVIMQSFAFFIASFFYFSLVLLLLLYASKKKSEKRNGFPIIAIASGSKKIQQQRRWCRMKQRNCVKQTFLLASSKNGELGMQGGGRNRARKHWNDKLNGTCSASLGGEFRLR